MIRTFAMLLGLLTVAGCVTDKPPSDEQPAFYLDMAHGGAKLDAAVAASMISGYRANNSLGPVTVDPELMKVAETQSMVMAKRNKMDHDVAGTLPKRLAAANYPATLAVENIGAGYHTLPRPSRAGVIRPASGQHAQERRHEIGHRSDLCSGYQIQGVLDAGIGVHRRAITTAWSRCRRATRARTDVTVPPQAD